MGKNEIITVLMTTEMLAALERIAVNLSNLAEDYNVSDVIRLAVAQYVASYSPTLSPADALVKWIEQHRQAPSDWTDEAVLMEAIE